MNLYLLVIKTRFPEQLVQQYELLSFSFEYHRHGSGPFHYASENNGLVLEIYPSNETNDLASNNLRIGFEVDDLDRIIEKLKGSSWKIISLPKVTKWGKIAVIEDIDGRKVELKSSKHNSNH